jgi:NarL family two-component system response regulator LiaR
MRPVDRSPPIWSTSAMPTAMLSHPPVGRSQDHIGVMLVDDHQVVLQALTEHLARQGDIDVVGAAGSVREVGRADQVRPDVCVVDYSLPDGTGADACRQIKARWPQARIVILSGQRDDVAVLGSLRAGADGYLTKDQPLSAVMAAIRDVHAHRPILGPAMLGTLARSIPTAPERPVLRERLTARELMVLRELARGRSTRQIASDLRIAQGTVRRHVEAIRAKFGVSSKLEAVSEALRHHIVELAPVV